MGFVCVRVGVNVINRYKFLSQTFEEMGMMKEMNWALKQYDSLVKHKSELLKDDSAVCMWSDDEIEVMHVGKRRQRCRHVMCEKPFALE